MKGKICTKCGIEKSLDDFYISNIFKKNSGACTYVAKKCKTCRQEYARIRKAFLSRYEEKEIKYRAFQVSNLTDSYIIGLLSYDMKTGNKEVRQNLKLSELIEQKRAIIQLKRSINNLKQEQNETSKC